MRKEFFDKLDELMFKDKSVYFVTGDLGYGFGDKIRDTFPDRFINVGAAEQTMMGVGIGLALQGKKSFVYSITPFLLWRPAEWIRNYIDKEMIPVILVGSGRGNDYEHDGFSHNASDDVDFINLFNNIEYYNYVPDLSKLNQPTYINLKR